MYIYTLSDPRSPDIVKYVGKTNNPYFRAYTHSTPSNIKSKTPKNDWIKSLIKSGVRPKLNIIDEVPVEEWGFWETFWIQQFKAWGFNLKNINPGGEGNNGPRSEEFKRKLSLSTKGVKKGPFTEDHKKNISLSKLGKKIVSNIALICPECQCNFSLKPNHYRIRLNRRKNKEHQLCCSVQCGLKHRYKKLLHEF